jgi:hypothetical protein
MRDVLSAAAMMALGGCSVGTMLELPAHEVDGYDTVQTFYKPLAANAVAAYLNPSSTSVEISDLKRSIAPQPGDWATCVRGWKEDKQLYFTVFIRGRAVYDTRRSIIIDRCHQAVFSVVARGPCPTDQDQPKPQARVQCWR